MFHEKLFGLHEPRARKHNQTKRDLKSWLLASHVRINILRLDNLS